MQGTQMLNLGPNFSEKVNPEGQQVAEEFPPGDLLEQTRSDVRRMRMQIERQEEQQESHERRTKILSVILGVLIAAIVGVLWLAYPTLGNQRKAVAQMLGLQNVAATLGEQMKSLGAKVDATSVGLPSLAQRMDQLQAAMKSNLQIARNQAQSAANEAGRRIRQDVNQSIQSIQ